MRCRTIAKALEIPDRQFAFMTDTLTIDRFLAKSLRSIRSDEPPPWNAALSGDSGRVWGRVEYHGIATLLHADAPLLGNWPENLLDRIAEEARLTALWEATHSRAVGQMIAGLARAGIESVVLKGSALAYWLYDDPSTRRRGDTDLLVHPDRLEATREALSESGWFRRQDVHGITRQEGWIAPRKGAFEHVVDLHWAPVDGQVLLSLLPLEDCLANRSALPRLDPSAFRPDPAFMLIHAAVNQKWHEQHGYFAETGRVAGARRLIWSVDFDLMIGAMEDEDWTELLTRCERAGAGAFIAETLRAVRNDLGTNLPEPVIEALDGQAPDPGLVRYFHTADELSGFILDLRSAGWRERGRMLAARAFPPRSHLIGKYPGSADWPISLLRARHMARGLMRFAQRALRA